MLNTYGLESYCDLIQNRDKDLARQIRSKKIKMGKVSFFSPKAPNGR